MHFFPSWIIENRWKLTIAKQWEKGHNYRISSVIFELEQSYQLYERSLRSIFPHPSRHISTSVEANRNQFCWISPGGQTLKKLKLIYIFQKSVQHLHVGKATHPKNYLRATLLGIKPTFQHLVHFSRKWILSHAWMIT